MTQKNASSFFTKVFIVSTLMILIVAGYIFYMYNNPQSTSMSLIVEKEKLVYELEQKRDSLNIEIKNNKEYKWDFVVEKNKISEILIALEKSDLNLKSILAYKSEIKQLRKKEIIQKEKRMQILQKRQEYQRDTIN